MEEININERTQNVKIKGILNNSSSRSRRDSSSFKHVVFIEPNDMKRKSIDSDDKRKIKIKKIVNKKNKLSNKKIIIKKTKQLSDNNVNLLNDEQNNTIKINKIIMKKKYSKINPIEKNFQLFQPTSSKLIYIYESTSKSKFIFNKRQDRNKISWSREKKIKQK